MICRVVSAAALVLVSSLLEVALFDIFTDWRWRREFPEWPKALVVLGVLVFVAVLVFVRFPWCNG